MVKKLSEREIKRLGLVEGTVSSIANVGLFALKLWVGMMTGSVAMVADAWHTLSDTVTSVVVIIGFWLSGKPGDEKHPFGHGRAELLGSIIIGTLLFVVGANFLKESYFHLRNAVPVGFQTLSVVVFAASAVFKEALAEFAIWAGKRTNSRSLIADGWHHRSDAVASTLIVIGSFLGNRFWWIDGVLGILVALLIVYAAFEIIRDTANVLLGEAADTALTKRILALVQEEAPDATLVHHIHVHRYGVHIEVTLHVHLPDGYSLKQAHDIATNLETLLRKKLDVEPTIHLEPVSETSLVK